MDRILDRKDLYMAEKDPKVRKAFKNSLLRKTNGHLGICEQLREIYDSIEYMKDQKLKERLTEQLIDAMIFAKKISDRLVYYSRKYSDGTGHKGKNLISIINNHPTIRHRWERKI